MNLRSPTNLGLPAAFSRWRPQQRYAVRRTLASDRRFVGLQLPTGSGKSLCAAALSRVAHGRTVILTATKSLQDQYASAFPHLFDIRGMGNYDCLAARDEFAHFFPRPPVPCNLGPCRSGMRCGLKEQGCTYFDAYREAIRKPAVLTSYAYWCATRRFGRGVGVAPMLICDEAHQIATELMGACRIEIAHRDLPSTLPTESEGWKHWATAASQAVRQTLDVTAKLKRRPLLDALDGLATVDRSWAWEETGRGMAFEPVMPKRLLPMLCDKTNTTVVFLSATVTAAGLSVLGVTPSSLEFIAFPSTFDPARRPVYLVPTCRVDARMSTTDRQYWLHRITQVVGARQDRKGVIHSVSFARMQEIVAALRAKGFGGIVLADDRAVRPQAETVRMWRERRGGCVLVSPSLTTGIDLPEAQYQIIAKMPFPDTRSPIMKARLAHNKEYRALTTAQTLVQMVGRIVRSDIDWGETIVLDDHSRWVVREYREYLPAWFLEAVVWSEKLPRPLMVEGE